MKLLRSIIYPDSWGEMIVFKFHNDIIETKVIVDIPLMKIAQLIDVFRYYIVKYSNTFKYSKSSIELDQHFLKYIFKDV